MLSNMNLNVLALSNNHNLVIFNTASVLFNNNIDVIQRLHWHYLKFLFSLFHSDTDVTFVQ